jgi:aminoglycoside/choline kinase family phosphotransferase
MTRAGKLRAEGRGPRIESEQAILEPGARAVLEEGLCAFLGQPVRIRALTRRPLDERSTYPIDRLRVTLDSGERLSVIFKRLHPGAEGKGDRREVLIYRRLLAGQRFGAPALYASVYDPEQGRYWLFLEDLGDQTLDGDPEHCRAAACCLAELHATYWGREAELRALDCLNEHGPDYYHMLARHARRNLEWAGAGRALARFDALMAPFPALVAFLTAQPRTLVHGDIFAGNFIVQPGPRVRAVDWEGAAIGLAAWDLARLLEGWGSDKPAFVRAYLAELRRHTRCAKAVTAVPHPQTFRETFGRCAALNVLWHLGWEAEDCRDAAFVDGLLDELEACWHDDDGGGWDG